MLFFCKEGHPIRIANEMPSYQLVSHTCHTSSFTWRRDISLYNLHFFQPSCFLSVLLAFAQSHLSLSRLRQTSHFSHSLQVCFSIFYFFYLLLLSVHKIYDHQSRFHFLLSLFFKTSNQCSLPLLDPFVSVYNKSFDHLWISIAGAFFPLDFWETKGKVKEQFFSTVFYLTKQDGVSVFWVKHGSF